MDSAFEADLEATVIKALDALENGEPLEKILQRHPGFASELRSILDMVTELSTVSIPSSPEAEERSRENFLRYGAELRQRKRRQQSSPLWRRVILTFATVAVVLLLLGGALVPLSQQAVPGDTLYPVKRTGEQVRYLLAPAAEKEHLRQSFEKERNREVYRMLEHGREGVAGYTGTIEAIRNDEWEIGHITVLITDETVIEGTPRIGARAEAHCRIVEGQVIAESLEVKTDDLAP